MDSIGIIGLVTGLWFALSTVDGERRSAIMWLGWVLACASAILLLAGTLSEPLEQGTGATVTTNWTTDPAPDSMPQFEPAGTGASQVGLPGTTQPACSPTCG